MPIAFQTLAGVPLFNGLPYEDLNEVLNEGQVRHLEPHADLLHAHNQPTHLIIVLQGQLQIMDVAEDGRIISVSFANPGDMVGLLSVIDDQPLVSNVASSMTSDLLLIPMNTARRIIFSQPAITERVMQLLARHIRKSLEDRRLLSLPNAFQRVFAQIASLSQQASASQNQVAALPKQHDIAVMVNTSRETVSRALQMLVKKGILVKEGHKIVIRHPDQLRQLANEGLDDSEARDQKPVWALAIG